MLLFVAGLFVGGFLGVLVTAMCAASARGKALRSEEGNTRAAS